MILPRHGVLSVNSSYLVRGIKTESEILRGITGERVMAKKKIARVPDKCGWTHLDICVTSKCSYWDWEKGCQFGKMIAGA